MSKKLLLSLVCATMFSTISFMETVSAKKMTEAQRAEQRAKIKSMTKEERQAFRAQKKAEREERLANMTPEQREKAEARKAKRKANKKK